MSRLLAMLLVGLVPGSALPAADQDPKDKSAKANVKLISFHVLRELDTKDFHPAYKRQNLIEIGLLVRLPGRQLIRVDETSRLTTFADDKGNSLMNPRDLPQPAFQGGLLTKDHSGILVGVANRSRAPTEGAGRILVKGDLVLVCGLEEKTTPEAKVDFKKSGDTKLGELTLRVDTKKGTASQPSIEVIGEARAVKVLTVLGEDGKGVETYSVGAADVRPGPRTLKFVLSRPIATGQVKVSYYSKEEKATVPIDLAVGAGL